MPLLDHYRPPISRTHPWRAFHGAWAAAIARQLNGGVLPPGFYAVPFLDQDGPIEIDVATLRGLETAPPAIDASDAAPWSPAAPALAVAVDWPAVDDVRVEIYSDEGDPRLAAAVELVSPRNKDRARARESFTAKCVGYLQRGCGLIVVDSVTTRRADLHADLVGALGAELPPAIASPLSAIAYRPVEVAGAGRLLIWPAPLGVGRPLPSLPLWLREDLSVPLDLEASHSATCDDLRIDRAGHTA